MDVPILSITIILLKEGNNMPRAKKEDTEAVVKKVDYGKVVTIRITLTDEMLGTAPNDKNIYHTFIESKAPDALSAKEEIEMVGIDEYADKQITVFRRDKNGDLILLGYLIKGFFKEACGARRDAPGTLSSKFTSYKKKIDRHIFPQKKIKLVLPEDDTNIGICERPLRAQTAQGDRVALACSESVPEGTTLEFEMLIDCSDMWPIVQEWLNYGKKNGLGQWHNSGKGTFTWELLDMRDATIDD
jgi:hypothetical protein